MVSVLLSQPQLRSVLPLTSTVDKTYHGVYPALKRAYHDGCPALAGPHLDVSPGSADEVLPAWPECDSGSVHSVAALAEAPLAHHAAAAGVHRLSARAFFTGGAGGSEEGSQKACRLKQTC